MYSMNGSKHGHMALALSVALACVIILASPVHSAVLHKRSIAHRESANDLETCRSDGICGWEVYDRHSRTRDPLYYVASLCQCSTEETCIRTGDDVSSSSYVYRCRVVRRNKSKSRTQATSGPNSTAASS